jgi:hypothetical protein
LSVVPIIGASGCGNVLSGTCHATLLGFSDDIWVKLNIRGIHSIGRSSLGSNGV